ncbi:MAG TPA: hypothetical protein VL966_20070 [Alphaproteobacteria bacterium]|nr:hypothetical protein [Alphaproteobacteria bacterium]
MIRWVFFIATLVIATSVAQPHAVMATPASALGPEIAAAQPANGFVGRIAVEPKHAPAGTLVHVTGQGFSAGESLDLVWRTVKGRWKVADGAYNGREYAPVGYRIANVTADSAGRIATTFTVPDDFGFQHDVVVQRGARLLTQTGFGVDMTMTVTPESGPIGTPITIEVKGIGWRPLENSWLLSYDNSFTGWVSAVSTEGTARVTIPATGVSGVHSLRLIHGEFTFPYLNPQQNPVPNRPRFASRFTVTDGAPVLPPAPEKQVQARVRGLPGDGELTVSPPFAPVGAPVEVRGTGFAPNKTVRLDWNTVTGNRVAAGSWEESSKTIAEAKSDASGRAVFRVNVPDDLGGAHSIVADDGARKLTGSVWVTPTALPLDIASGPAGTTFTIHLKGIGWTETANIYHVVYDNNYSGYACGFNSQGDITVFLPMTGEPGWHFVDLYPGIYKGQENRPNNFRIPQLTYAADHPGEDLPAFHFAVEVTGKSVGQ